jgi:hypothetical protein
MPRSSSTARQLVDQRRPPAHQPVAGAMQALQVEPVLALELDEAHRRPGRGLGDRAVPVVVFLRLHAGPHVVGRHQPDLVALIAEEAAEIVRAAAGLHRHHAGGQSGRKFGHPVPR